MFPLWANRSRRHYEEKQAAIRQQQEQAMQTQEDFLMGAERRVITALTRAQERKASIEAQITKLEADLADTNIVLRAMEAANNVMQNENMKDIEQCIITSVAETFAPVENHNE